MKKVHQIERFTVNIMSLEDLMSEVGLSGPIEQSGVMGWTGPLEPLCQLGPFGIMKTLDSMITLGIKASY